MAEEAVPPGRAAAVMLRLLRPGGAARWKHWPTRSHCGALMLEIATCSAAGARRGGGRRGVRLFRARPCAIHECGCGCHETQGIERPNRYPRHRRQPGHSLRWVSPAQAPVCPRLISVALKLLPTSRHVLDLETACCMYNSMVGLPSSQEPAGFQLRWRLCLPGHDRWPFSWSADPEQGS